MLQFFAWCKNKGKTNVYLFSKRFLMNNVLLKQIFWNLQRINGNALFFECKILKFQIPFQKNIPQELGDIWVIEGARTPDPQNHNLML